MQCTIFNEAKIVNIVFCGQPAIYYNILFY